MAKVLKRIKSKAKETAATVKDVLVDNKEVIIGYGVAAGILVGCVVYGRHNSKKYEAAWRNAKKAFENGQLDADFGPYKLMRFFEPGTGDFIGETMCHEESMKAFLDLK